MPSSAKGTPRMAEREGRACGGRTMARPKADAEQRKGTRGWRSAKGEPVGGARWRGRRPKPSRADASVANGRPEGEIDATRTVRAGMRERAPPTGFEPVLPP